jgi:hypothetical protein
MKASKSIFYSGLSFFNFHLYSHSSSPVLERQELFPVALEKKLEENLQFEWCLSSIPSALKRNASFKGRVQVISIRWSFRVQGCYVFTPIYH